MKLLSAIRCPLSVVLCLAVLGLIRGETPRKQRTTDNGQRTSEDVQDVVFLADSRPVLIRLHLRLDGKPYLKAWNAFMDELFALLDKNKDGVLNKDEAAKAPPPSAIFNSNANGFFAFGKPGGGGAGDMDADGDGKVSRAELADYYRKNGGAPFQLIGGNGGADSVWATRAFLDVTGLPGGSSGSADALNKALLALLDTDKDGKLSRKELAAAPARLLKKDANDDEMVTSAELLGQASPAQGGYRLLVSGSVAVPLTADSPFVTVTPGVSARALAKRLRDKYGPKGKGGRLGRKELGLDAATFKLLDADEDGQLDAEELARFTQRPPDVELTVRLGKDGGVGVTEVKGRPLPAGIKVKVEKAPAVGGMPLPAPPFKLKLKGYKAAPPADHVGGRPRDMVTLAVGNTHVELRLASGNAGGITYFPDTEQFYKMQFSAIDKDNNGYLDANEARRSFFGSLFKLMDADGDGKLYLKEVLAYVRMQKVLKEKASACCLTLSVSDQGRGLFDLLDTNGDGRLSVREMRNAIKLIDRLDRNGDGKIDRGEIPRRYALDARRGPADGGSQVFAITTAFGAPSRPSAPQPQKGPLWFRKMDRNGDGDVSRKEWLGSEELFKKIDTDGDGLVSLEEATKADALTAQAEEVMVP